MWGKILTFIATHFGIPFVLGVLEKLKIWYEEKKTNKKIKDDAKKSRDKMDKAKSAKEIDEASDETLDGI